ncbi:hypothetical protein ACSYTR_12740 [Staphylococcus warneri]|uniref:hypothetical protein n=1 Tax=Staphylococcus warneri TaxID=1292 RepID=UPI003EE74075
MAGITGSTNTQIGNYFELKAAHLEHDEEKYNNNFDIDYSLKHLNTNHVHVENFDDFYYQKYEKPIEEKNAKHKERRQYGRMHKDFNDYKQKQINSGRRKKKGKNGKDVMATSEKDENRLALFRYGSFEDQKQILIDFKNMGFTKEETLRAIAKGLDDHVENFNKKHTNMKVVEHFTHVNEGSAHSHGNLYSYGLDKNGNPFYDINQALRAEYGDRMKTQFDKNGKIKRDKDGNLIERKPNVKELWKHFRNDTDRSIVKNVNKELVGLAKTKDKDYTPPRFIRKEAKDVGNEHDRIKENKKREESRKITVKSLNKMFSVAHGRKTEITFKPDNSKLKDKSYDEVMRAVPIILGHVVEPFVQQMEKQRQRYDELKPKVDEFEQRENELNERESKINSKELELNQREDTLNNREIDIVTRDINLEKRINNFNDFVKDNRKVNLSRILYDDVYNTHKKRGELDYFHERLEMLEQEEYRSTAKPKPKEKDFGPEL